MPDQRSGTALLLIVERQTEVLFMAVTAAHEFGRHGGDIERCVHHPCDLPEVKECVRWKREKALSL